MLSRSVLSAALGDWKRNGGIDVGGRERASKEEYGLEPRRRITVREERRAVTGGDVRVESDRVVGHGCGKRSDAECGVVRAGNGVVLWEETG